MTEPFSLGFKWYDWPFSPEIKWCSCYLHWLIELLFVLAYRTIICIGLCIRFTHLVLFSSAIYTCFIPFRLSICMSFNIFSSVYVSCSVTYIVKKYPTIYFVLTVLSLDLVFFSLLLPVEFVKLTPNLAPQMMR